MRKIDRHSRVLPAKRREMTDKPAPIDAVAVGVNVVDVLLRLPDRFTRGDKQPAGDIGVHGGGPAATAACVLGSLGWRTGFVTRLGNDALSMITRAEFNQYGVVDDFFIADPEASPVAAVVQVDARTGERTIFYKAEHYHLLKSADIPFDAIRQAKVVLVDGYEREAAASVLQMVRDAGGRSVLDIEEGDAGSAMRFLELGTDCILPLSQARTLTGAASPEDVLRGLRKRTDAQLVVTDGVHGSWALTTTGVLHQPAFAVTAVDTTGCGDAFHGAYAAGILGGLPLRCRMEFAAWVAAQVALGLGGRSHLPTRDSLRHVDHSVFSAELRSGLSSPRWHSR
jgi:sugar/nucleoside kinase (ribokinase family)